MSDTPVGDPQASDDARFFALTSEFLAVLDADGRIERVNPAWQRALGDEPDGSVGGSFLSLLDSQDRPRAARALRDGTGAVVTLESGLASAHGRTRRLQLRLSRDPATGRSLIAAGYAGVPADDTPRGRTPDDADAIESQLRDALRMEAIGRLAGGIAHDFNNLLTAINGYSRLLLASLPPNDPRRDDAEQISVAGERAAALTSQLLAFARRGDLQPEVIDVHSVIAAVAPMLGSVLGREVELRLELGAEEPLVMADGPRLEQVLVNLSVNARDAMPDGGRLTVRSRGVELTGPRRLGGVMIRPGSYIEIRMRDTGIGMDSETKRRIFEPFFTTKAPGRGTGLGMAMAYGTVRQSGGHVRVLSAPGKGTTFVIMLPRARGESGRDGDQPIDAQMSP